MRFGTRIAERTASLWRAPGLADTPRLWSLRFRVAEFFHREPAKSFLPGIRLAMFFDTLDALDVGRPSEIQARNDPIRAKTHPLCRTSAKVALATKPWRELSLAERINSWLRG